MSRIIVHLTFSGNCRQAMQFYRDCLGGELHLLQVGDTTLGNKMPRRMKHAILNATLTKGKLQLCGSDLPDDDGLQRGNAVTLLLLCRNENEIRSYYNKLSRGGYTSQPLEAAHGGGFAGNLTDRFGNRWILRSK